MRRLGHLSDQHGDDDESLQMAVLLVWHLHDESDRLGSNGVDR